MWHAWKQAEEKISWLEATIKSLQQGLNLKRLEYETDEDQLEWDTGQNAHKIGKKNKKRKANMSPDTSPELLPQELPSKEQPTNKNNNEKEHLPPSIFVSGVRDFNSFKRAVLQDVKYDASFKMLANEEVKINTTKSEDYRSVVHQLKEAKVKTNSPLYDTAFYTYQCKQAKPYKIIIRGLHPSTDQTDIKRELEEL